MDMILGQSNRISLGENKVKSQIKNGRCVNKEDVFRKKFIRHAWIYYFDM